MYTHSTISTPIRDLRPFRTQFPIPQFPRDTNVLRNMYNRPPSPPVHQTTSRKKTGAGGTDTLVEGQEMPGSLILLQCPHWPILCGWRWAALAILKKRVQIGECEEGSGRSRLKGGQESDENENVEKAG